MDSLLPNQRQDCTSFMKAFDYCLYGVGARVRLGPLRFLHRDKKWHDSIQVVHKQVDRYIDKAIKSLQDAKAGSSELDEKPDRYVLLN
jgi:cytochrome P450 monooxygenase